ncbi:hypothetical protein GCM10017600_72980 [Streptosporangium carneum]|uniref:Uncharacterized protein n=1 Tax=Streptosporangium carneum TaxID=47481 RepID=A0A9W6MH76_9ACTN|nr:hypothetical protein GCM10017600_72980 [Streptosporangium carneum]
MNGGAKDDVNDGRDGDRPDGANGGPRGGDRVRDPRRWAAFQCFGVFELLFEVHASYEDLIGTLDEGFLPVAKFVARDTVVRALAIRSLLREGFPPDEHDTLADPYAGLTEDEIERGLAAARAVARAADVPAAREAAEQVGRYVAELERDLGFTAPPASIRGPSGLFPALRLTRTLLPLNEATGLPTAFPAAWT